MVCASRMLARMFQSSPDSKAGCYCCRIGGGDRLRRFNPHPTRRPGATAVRCAATIEAMLFQSSPDPKAGCYLADYAREVAWRCFNPHPTRRPGATWRTMPGRWRGGVSILTRPEGRVLHAVAETFTSDDVFQSSPDPKAGCYYLPSLSFSTNGRFNPHPTRRPGATTVGPHKDVHPGVSILTRPEGRVLLGNVVGAAWKGMFQSSPDPKAGCYARGNVLWVCSSGFNPHPTRRPGATNNRWLRVGAPQVSILTRPEGRVL